MKKLLAAALALSLAALGALAQPAPAPPEHHLAYFLPQGNFTYNPAVPTPEQALGFEVAQQHADWGCVLRYMEALAQASPRVTIRETGRTYQHRPFVELVLTSEANQQRISQIKADHLRLSDPDAAPDTSEMPVVVSLVYSIHGNESSGVNAALAIAYFLAAAQGPEADDLLRHTVVVMTPGANPDGINRFASWVNAARSLTDVSDTNSREFQEAWPSGRTNHYWADCNRDMLMAQHPEGVNALDNYFEWLPNVVVDHHEQGASHPFYMSPGNIKRVHHLLPRDNQAVTAEISAYTARELDKIGTAYYSKEGYDDYYIGKGACYGDVHGSVCLLYEQTAIRGHLRNTIYGTRSFAWAVRNQAYASYASVLAACRLRLKLLDYQQRFYRDSRADAARQSVKGYVFNARGDNAILYHFLDNMAHHRLDVYRLAKNTTAAGKTFDASDSYILPVNQKYSAMARAVMESLTTFPDSTFYDISAWTFPHAFNLECAPVAATAGLLGDKVTANAFTRGRVVGGKSAYGYFFPVSGFYSYKIINELQRRGLYLSACRRPLTLSVGGKSHRLPYGTIQVLVDNQPLDADAIHDALQSLAAETGTDVYAVQSGLMDDFDSASPAFTRLRQPTVAVITGRGCSVTESGEVWHQLDYRMQMRPVMVDYTTLTPRKLQNYNTIIIAASLPPLGKDVSAALKQWVAEGGTLITTGKGYAWVRDNGLMDITTKTAKTAKTAKADSTAYKAYATRGASAVGSSIPGTIMQCHIDKTHPLCWGFDQDCLAVMKQNNIIFAKSANAYASPLYYTDTPRLSGYVSHRNLQRLKRAPAAFAAPYKAGTVVAFADDPLFRSYFFGTAKLMMNAIFFGPCIR